MHVNAEGNKKSPSFDGDFASLRTDPASTSREGRNLSLFNGSEAARFGRFGATGFRSPNRVRGGRIRFAAE